MQRRAGPACRHLDTHLHPLPGDTQSISMTMLVRVTTSRVQKGEAAMLGQIWGGGCFLSFISFTLFAYFSM